MTSVGCGEINSGSRTPPCGPFGDPPVAATTSVKPWCAGGNLLGPWRDSEGTDRYACLYEPANARPGLALPMVVYLHPSFFGVWTIRLTGLLKSSETIVMTDDPGKAGFIVLAPVGRQSSHFYPFPDNNGIGWDNWYRQLKPGNMRVGDSTYPENVDAAAIDHFIELEVVSGKADKSRIYMTGWSNGAAMAYLYAVNRPDIAAVSVYSAPNPFDALGDVCPQVPVARDPIRAQEIQLGNPAVPTMHVHNACDAVGICPSAERMASELRAANVNVEDVILNPIGQPTNGCYDACGSDPEGNANLLTNPLGWSLGLSDHMMWPTGQTPAMLDFLRRYSHHFQARSPQNP